LRKQKQIMNATLRPVFCYQLKDLQDSLLQGLALIAEVAEPQHAENAAILGAGPDQAGRGLLTGGY
jgi:hypothetical protein